MAEINIAQVYAGLHYADAGRWNSTVVTYSIPTALSVWSTTDYPPGDEPSNADYSVFNAAQRTAFVDAVAAWDRLISLDLLEVPDNGGAGGDIRIAFTDVDDYADDAGAYAYRPAGAGFRPAGFSGDIWFDNDYKNDDPSPGSYFYSTLLHELGHSLGLKHPFSGTTLPAGFDTRRYTVMSYTNLPDGEYRYFYEENGQVIAATYYVEPSTPMLLDVLAIQGLYGAAGSIDPGATTYTFDESEAFLRTIVDTGGIDTLDLSDHDYGSVVDLTPGSFSSISFWSLEEQIRTWTELFPKADPRFIADYLSKPGLHTWSNNLAIDFNTIIENVKGGVDDDLFRGNSAANSLSGGGGSDEIYGGLGNDTIDGGSATAKGNYLRGDDGNDSLIGGGDFDDLNGNMGADTVSTGAGNDFCVGGKDHDLLFGGDGADFTYGNLGDDTCNGEAGADTVRGGQGADTLSGGDGADFVSGDRGDDTMTGGAGADVFHSSSDAGIDRVLDFSLADGDRVLLDPGTTFTVAQVGGDTVIQMSAGQVILVGVSVSSLPPGTIFGA